MIRTVFSTFLFISVTFVILKRKKRIRDTKKSFPLHKLNWEKDVIYIVQFPVSQKVRSISPFSIKLESWIRMTNLKYECVYSSQGGAKRQIPYIEFNGEHIPDSNVAIQFLKGYFKDTNPKVIQEYINLTPEQLAVGHMTRQMLENHTCVVGFYWRYGLNMQEFYEKMIKPADEIAQFSFMDFEAISRYLGDKKFFFGDEISSIDCTLYGHMAQFLYIPMAFPQKKYIQDKCPNILSYMARFQAKIWPDWENACKLECMAGKMGRRFKGNSLK